MLLKNLDERVGRVLRVNEAMIIWREESLSFHFYVHERSLDLMSHGEGFGIDPKHGIGNE